MKIVFIVITFFNLLPICTFGQTNKKKNYLPIWTYHQKKINIHGLSFGLGTWSGDPRYTNTNGIKFELIGM